jgi:hypothetical protein
VSLELYFTFERSLGALHIIQDVFHAMLSELARFGKTDRPSWPQTQKRADRPQGTIFGRFRTGTDQKCELTSSVPVSYGSVWNTYDAPKQWDFKFF